MFGEVASGDYQPLDSNSGGTDWRLDDSEGTRLADDRRFHPCRKFHPGAVNDLKSACRQSPQLDCNMWQGQSQSLYFSGLYVCAFPNGKNEIRNSETLRFPWNSSTADIWAIDSQVH